MHFWKFPLLVGRYRSYLLPKQLTKKNITKYHKWRDTPVCRWDPEIVVILDKRPECHFIDSSLGQANFLTSVRCSPRIQMRTCRPSRARRGGGFLWDRSWRRPLKRSMQRRHILSKSFSLHSNQAGSLVGMLFYPGYRIIYPPHLTFSPEAANRHHFFCFDLF